MAGGTPKQTKRRHKYTAGGGGGGDCVSCRVLQSEDMQTIPAIYAIQCPKKFFFPVII